MDDIYLLLNTNENKYYSTKTGDYEGINNGTRFNKNNVLQSSKYLRDSDFFVKIEEDGSKKKVDKT
jgi:hypothetical protein